MRESKVETYFKKRVKHFGGETRKLGWINRDSAPDQLAMFSGLHLLAEIKADDLPGTFPRDDHERKQDREHRRLRAAGFKVYVLESFEDVDRMLDAEGFTW